MEWLTPSELDPFDPADLVCTLCKVNLAHEEWPRHVWTEDHQKRAYAKCVVWDNLKRSCIFIIYCNIAVEPISIMEYIRQTCDVELKDFILVPGKPTVAILQFHSSKEYMTVLYHSKQTEIRCGDIIVTHLKPAAEISDAGWMSLVANDVSKQTLNYHENGHIGISPILPPPRTPFERHSPLPGPSSSSSSQKLPDCPQGPESVRRLHQLAIDSGWPPPKFERQISDRLAGKYTAKVMLNGRVFCSNNLAGDYSTACKIAADDCLNILEKEKKIPKEKEITKEKEIIKRKVGQTLLQFESGRNATDDLHRLVTNRDWCITEINQYKKEKKPGKGQIYFYSCYINHEQFFSPIGGTTREKGIAQLSAYCLKKLFNITRYWQTNLPAKTAPIQVSADSRQCSGMPSSSSSSLTSSIHSPANPHLHTNISDRPKKNQHSDATTISSLNLNKSQSVSPLSTPTIAARISQPAKRKLSEDPVISTDRNHTRRQMTLNNNDRSSTTEELMLGQPERSIPLPSLSKPSATPIPSTSQNIKTNKILTPEIEVVYDDTKSSENEIAQPQSPKPCGFGDEIMLINEGRKKPEENLQNAKVKVKREKYASPWPQFYLHGEYINSLEYPVYTLEKICLVCNWERPSYDLVVSQSSTDESSERFSYKMTLNKIEYKNKRVETTKKRAQEKVVQICLSALVHNGEIPHPSVFMNISLNPVERLENLIVSRRLSKSTQDDPKYTLIKDVEHGGYYCEVTLNGESYFTGTSGISPSETEWTAKQKAAEFCLQQLSSSIPLYADGSFIEKSKTALMTMCTEIPTITRAGKESQANMENFKNQCKNIFTQMKIPEKKSKSAKAIVKKLENLIPGLQAIMYRNWFMNLKSYAGADQLFIFVFKTNDNNTSIIPADPEEIEKQILQSKEKFPGLTVTTLANKNSARHFKESVQNFESRPSFVLETDLSTLDEVHLCRLIHYISEFDSRFFPVLSLLRYWAKINGVQFHLSDNSNMRNIWGNPYILDLLLVSFLGGAGVIPTARELLERKSRFSKQNEKQIFLQPDADYVKQWRSNGRPFKSNSVEFWISVLVLTKNFFVYYADRLKEGSWVFNICDSEMIFCLDLFYGSFHTKLSPEKLKKLMLAKVLDREKIKRQSDSNDSQIYMMIPINRNSIGNTNLNWVRMVNEMIEFGSSTVFDLMRIAGTRLNKILDDFPQNDLDLESILNCRS